MNTTNEGQGAAPDSPTSALARLLADDRPAGDPQVEEISPSVMAEAAAAFLLAPPPPPAPGLTERVLALLPRGDPTVFSRLGRAVLDAWCDPAENRRWRADAVGMATALGLPPELARQARVVEAGAGHLPHPMALEIPLPPPEAATGPRAEALRRLAATEFGWLLAGEPGGAEALGLTSPSAAAAEPTSVSPATGRSATAELLASWLRPRRLLLAGGLACLAAAIGLTVSLGTAGGGSYLSGATIGAAGGLQLAAIGVSLGLGLLLLARAARR